MSEHEASMMELIPPAIKERILRLQAENKRLKQGQKQEEGLKQYLKSLEIGTLD